MLTDIVPRDHTGEMPRDILARESANPAVIIAHGYGIQMKVLYGRLTIEDGVGRNRRERKIGKSDRTVKRIVVTGQTGFISLESLRWCAEHGISVITSDANGEVISHHVPDEIKRDIRILRAQVLAPDSPLALEIAREINIHKLDGQARNLESLFSDYNASAQVWKYAKAMDKAASVSVLMGLEGKAATTYFTPWLSHVAPRWDAKSLARIPSNWLTWPGRQSTIRSASNRAATDPISAMLNYGYAIGYSEARIACIATGLDPRIGFLHYGQRDSQRDSLALDILEVIRPAVDAYVVGLVRSREFTHRDFCEPYGYDPGTCRVVAPLTHEIAEQSVLWSEVALEAARMVAGMLV